MPSVGFYAPYEQRRAVIPATDSSDIVATKIPAFYHVQNRCKASIEVIVVSDLPYDKSEIYGLKLRPCRPLETSEKGPRTT